MIRIYRRLELLAGTLHSWMAQIFSRPPQPLYLCLAKRTDFNFRYRYPSSQNNTAYLRQSFGNDVSAIRIMCGKLKWQNSYSHIAGDEKYIRVKKM